VQIVRNGFFRPRSRGRFSARWLAESGDMGFRSTNKNVQDNAAIRGLMQIWVTLLLACCVFRLYIFEVGFLIRFIIMIGNNT